MNRFFVGEAGRCKSRNWRTFGKFQKSLDKSQLHKTKKEWAANKLSCEWTGPSSFCVFVCHNASACMCRLVGTGSRKKKNRVERSSPGTEGLHVWSFWHAALLTRSKWGEGDHVALLATLTTHRFFFCLRVSLRVGSLNDGDTVGCKVCLPSKHFPHSALSSLAALQVFLQRKHDYWLSGKRHF